MRARSKRWLTAQETAAELNSTSAEICRLVSIGRLRGVKKKQAGRPGKKQWLIDPGSVQMERRLQAKRAAKARRKKSPQGHR